MVIDAEQLLRHSEWARALARHLVGDAADAEDIVQEAWIAALASPAPKGALRPWLAGVIRRLALMGHRTAARRSVRERAASRSEALPTTDELVARAETQRILADAVLALDEPYRSVVMLRYFENRTSAEIARDRGIPAGTVRSQLHDGLARLRVMLDSRFGGDRSSWCTALLPLAGVKAAAAAGVSSQVFTGLLLMKTTKIAAGLAAAAVLFALAYTFVLAPPGGTDRSSTPVAALRSAADRERTDMGRGQSGSAAAETPANRDEMKQETRTEGPPPPGAVLPLKGLVVDIDRQPIAGADVVVAEELGAGFSMLTEQHHIEEHGRCKTDGEGRFSLPVPFARRLRLSVRAEGFAPAELEDCYAGEDREVTLRHGATLAGRITDAPTGVPVGGVALRARPKGHGGRPTTGVSAADGTFRFAGLPPGRLLLDVTPPEHEHVSGQAVDLTAGETTRLDLELRRGGAVFGTVTDAETGLPISGAEIGAGWTFKKVVRTDAAGNYRMRGAPGPGVPDMHARATGYAQARKHVLAGAGGTEEERVDFALHRAGSVRGRVVDPAGIPQAGVYVAASAHLGVEAGMVHSDWQHVRSGGDGIFRIRGLVPGAEYTLFLRHRGRATTALHVPGTIDPHRESDVGDLILEAPAVLLGRVVDREGRGVAARVDLQGTNDDCGRLLAVEERGRRLLPSHVSFRHGRTDPSGRFRFADLAAGTYALSAWIAGAGVRSEPRDVQVIGARTTAGVEVVIDLGATLAGTVVTEDGSPLPQHVAVRIRAAGDNKGPKPGALVAGDGSFRVLGLEEGRYHLRADVARWINDEPAPWIGGELKDVAAGREDLRIVLHPAAFVSGRVLDAAGRPRAGIVVMAVPAVGASGRTTRGATDDGGNFRLRVRRGAVVDLRYGEAPPSAVPVLYRDPRPETARVYRGAAAGAKHLVLELR